MKKILIFVCIFVCLCSPTFASNRETLTNEALGRIEKILTMQLSALMDMNVPDKIAYVKNGDVPYKNVGFYDQTTRAILVIAPDQPKPYIGNFKTTNSIFRFETFSIGMHIESIYDFFGHDVAKKIFGRLKRNSPKIVVDSELLVAESSKYLLMIRLVADKITEIRFGRKGLKVDSELGNYIMESKIDTNCGSLDYLMVDFVGGEKIYP